MSPEFPGTPAFHPLRSLLVRVALFATALAGFASLEGAEPAEGWQVIKNPYFSFSIPATFKKTPVRGIDSFVAQYDGDGITLSFDYGWYTGKLDGLGEGTKYEDVKLGDDAARLATMKKVAGPGAGRFWTGIYLKREKETSALGMYADCRSEQEVAIARKIFLSVRLAPPAAKPAK